MPRYRPNHAKSVKKLKLRGWKYDGLWWWSPYTSHRYSMQDALDIEDLRSWSEGDSAFLNDKDHSMWAQKEIDDNALCTMEELSERSKQNLTLKELGRLSK